MLGNMCRGKVCWGREDRISPPITRHCPPHAPIAIALVAACPFARQKADSMYIAVAALDTRMRETDHTWQSVKPVPWDPSGPVQKKYIPKVNTSNEEHHSYLVRR